MSTFFKAVNNIPYYLDLGSGLGNNLGYKHKGHTDKMHSLNA